jgi:hypothetical protein
MNRSTSNRNSRLMSNGSMLLRNRFVVRYAPAQMQRDIVAAKL